jgi:mRNA interferase MazF
VSPYTPQKGDFITITFDPQSGHEQKGRRPALVISNTPFNEHTGLVIVCPVTNTEKRFPFHVAIKGCDNVTGFVMVEQVKSLDFRSRNIKQICKSPESILEEVLAVLDTIIY